jgi:hypothetical protein
LAIRLLLAYSVEKLGFSGRVFFVCGALRARRASKFPSSQAETIQVRRALSGGSPSALRNQIAPYRGRFFAPAPKPSFSTE